MLTRRGACCHRRRESRHPTASLPSKRRLRGRCGLLDTSTAGGRATDRSPAPSPRRSASSLRRRRERHPECVARRVRGASTRRPRASSPRTSAPPATLGATGRAASRAGRADTGIRSSGSKRTPSVGRRRIVRSRSSWIFALVRSTWSRTRSHTPARIAKLEPIHQWDAEPFLDPEMPAADVPVLAEVVGHGSGAVELGTSCEDAEMRIGDECAHESCDPVGVRARVRIEAGDDVGVAQRLVVSAGRSRPDADVRFFEQLGAEGAGDLGRGIRAGVVDDDDPVSGVCLRGDRLEALLEEVRVIAARDHHGDARREGHGFTILPARVRPAAALRAGAERVGLGRARERSAGAAGLGAFGWVALVRGQRAPATSASQPKASAK